MRLSFELRAWIVALGLGISCLLDGSSLRAESPPDLDAWLSSHPQVAAALIWETSNTVSDSPTLRDYRAEIVWKFPWIHTAKQKTETKTGWSSLRTVKNFQIGYKNNSLSPADLPVTQPWNLWPSSHKQKVRDEYAKAWNWLAVAWPKYLEYVATGVKPADFDATFSTAEPAGYPPVDLQFGHPGSTKTIFSASAAFDLYSQMVGFALAAETMRIFPWSVVSLPTDGLREIFNGTLWFDAVKEGPLGYEQIHQTGYILTTSVVPAPPRLVFSFLARERLFGTSKQETVVKVLEWERYNLSHTQGGTIHDDCPVEGSEVYDGYKGSPPLSRVINGTVMACPLWYPDASKPGGEGSIFYPEPMHWTGGCGGTAGFNEQVFRVANIPAPSTSYNHYQNAFLIDNNARVWIGHADDPYSINSYTEIPTSAILIDDATWQSWSVDYDWNDPNLTQAQKDAYNAQNIKANQLRIDDLIIQYLPKGFIIKHCWYDQGKPHDQSYLYSSLSKTHTLAELEAIDFWGQVEAKIASLGGCTVPWP